MAFGFTDIGSAVSNASQAHAGATNVSGIGGAIRGILEDARAKGLTTAQSDAQTAGSGRLDLLKRGRDEEDLAKPTSIFIPGATADQDRVVDKVGDTPLTRGMDVQKLGQNKEDVTLEILRGFGIIPPADGTTTVPPVTDNDPGGSELHNKAAAWLRERGASLDPKNIQAVIDAGKVQ